MNGCGGDPVELVIRLISENVAYPLFTLIVSMVIGVTPMDVFSGPFSGAARSLGWDGLLSVVEILAVFGFISSPASG
jgi:hypothetical protein